MKKIKLSDFEYDQIIVILETELQNQREPMTSTITGKVGAAWIKKLVNKLKRIEETK